MSAVSAAEGTSIITPTSIFSACGTFCWRNSSRTSSSRRRAAINSERSQTIGNMIADISLRAGAADGAQLRAENIGPAERIADAAKTEERIDLLLDAEVRPLLVAADIERADDEMVRLGGLRHLQIHLHLLVLARAKRPG